MASPEKPIELCYYESDAMSSVMHGLLSKSDMIDNAFNHVNMRMS